MNKKIYVAPTAQRLSLVPAEDVALNWYWGLYQRPADMASLQSAPMDVWKDDPWSAEANASTYKYD